MKDKKATYKVLPATGLDELGRVVTKYLNNGWLLAGSSFTYENDAGVKIFCQPVTIVEAKDAERR
jgi:hypothetical protein